MFDKLKAGRAPSRNDIETLDELGVTLHPQTMELVHDATALQHAFGSNGAFNVDWIRLRLQVRHQRHLCKLASHWVCIDSMHGWFAVRFRSRSGLDRIGHASISVGLSDNRPDGFFGSVVV